MTYTPTQAFTFDEFITQYGDDFRYELADGEAQHAWVKPRTCLIRPFSDTATARRPDLVVLDETVLSSEPRWIHQSR